jgi:molybdenum cofactor biosynthesis enzyme MoaA
VRKLRITGGEPLVPQTSWLFRAFRTSAAADELTLTTSGSQLPKFARS